MSDDREPPPAFPTRVRIALVIWAICGLAFWGMTIFGLITSTSSTASEPSEARSSRQPDVNYSDFFQAARGFVFSLLWGAALLAMSLRAKSLRMKDTQASGVGVILLGLLLLATSIGSLITQPASEIGVVLVCIVAIIVLAGSALIASGVLALLGRKEYKTYRTWVLAGARRARRETT